MNTLLLFILIASGAAIIAWQAPAVISIRKQLSSPLIDCEKKDRLEQELRDRILILVLVAFAAALVYQHNA
jgi:hypothetical protein